MEKVETKYQSLKKRILTVWIYGMLPNSSINRRNLQVKAILVTTVVMLSRSSSLSFSKAKTFFSNWWWLALTSLFLAIPRDVLNVVQVYMMGIFPTVTDSLAFFSFQRQSRFEALLDLSSSKSSKFSVTRHEWWCSSFRVDRVSKKRSLSTVYFRKRGWRRQLILKFSQASNEGFDCSLPEPFQQHSAIA